MMSPTSRSRLPPLPMAAATVPALPLGRPPSRSSLKKLPSLPGMTSRPSSVCSQSTCVPSSFSRPSSSSSRAPSSRYEFLELETSAPATPKANPDLERSSPLWFKAGLSRSVSLPQVSDASLSERPAPSDGLCQKVGDVLMPDNLLLSVASSPLSKKPSLQKPPSFGKIGPPSVKTSTVGKKRSVSVPAQVSGATPENADTHRRGKSRRRKTTTSSRLEGDGYEYAQVAVLKLLTKDLMSKPSTFVALVQQLTQAVVDHSGQAPFSVDLVKHVVCKVRNVDENHKQEKEENLGKVKGAVTLVMEMLRGLSDHARLPFCDVAGQILWSFRKNAAFSQSRHKHVVDDLEWLQYSLGFISTPSGFAQRIDFAQEVFQSFTDNPDGRMTFRGFKRAMEHVLKLYSFEGHFEGTKKSMQRSECEGYFHAEAKRDDGRSLSSCGFKRVLMQLSRSLGAHPRQVLTRVRFPM
eukprot:TRINITY_DN31936_c0_g1_i1.p1 TRINITY_DN31936_c0_g1~~TRINITY_DN31936_c0_g1_i1.p1  ORF type:complete len:465 (-),score=39.47 TRINITY_DN31936_c0_g1_i1:327-1721(-)